MKIHSIESAKNPIYRGFLGLLTTKGIGESGQALIFGEKPVKELIQERPDVVGGIILAPKMNAPLKSGQAYTLGQGLFEKLDIFGTGFPIALVNTPEIRSLSAAILKGCSVYIPFQDPSNVGALLRSAAGFGVSQIIFGPGAANPFHPKSSRAASGSLFRHQYFKTSDITELKAAFPNRIALDVSGTSITKFSYPENFLLIPGAEGPGLSEEIKNISTSFLSIPLLKGIDSLNAMVATSIALFDWRSKNL